jgi:hypothetical protein
VSAPPDLLVAVATSWRRARRSPALAEDGVSDFTNNGDGFGLARSAGKADGERRIDA